MVGTLHEKGREALNDIYNCRSRMMASEMF